MEIANVWTRQIKAVIENAQEEIEKKQMYVVLSSMTDDELQMIAGITRKEIPEFVEKHFSTK